MDKFRLFMKGCAFIGASQFSMSPVPEIEANARPIAARLVDFADEFLTVSHLDDAIVDVFLEQDADGGWRAVLLDINPLIWRSDPASFVGGNAEILTAASFADATGECCPWRPCLLGAPPELTKNWRVSMCFLPLSPLEGICISAPSILARDHMSRSGRAGEPIWFASKVFRSRQLMIDAFAAAYQRRPVFLAVRRSLE